MSLRNLLAALFALVVSLSASAFMPTPGLWVIDAENNGHAGRGFQVETQGDVLVFTYYGYLSGGAAQWYLSSGTLTNGVFTGNLEGYAGGTALGSSYASATDTGSAGTVTLNFSNESAGTITLPGESAKAIKKFYWVDNAFPSVRRNVGEYFVYMVMRDQSSSTPAVYTYTVTPTAVAQDGSYTVVETYSKDWKLSTYMYDSGYAESFYSEGTYSCNYTPSYRAAPPLTVQAGDVYSASSTSSCIQSGTSTTTALSVNGTAVGPEIHTTALGSFSAFKWTNAKVSTPQGGPTETTNSTCWTDEASGRLIECDYATSGSPSGTRSETLIAYSYKGQTHGAIIMRFAGYWTVNYTGSGSGSCNVVVDVSGSMSGSCTSSQGAFTVTGTVDSAGNMAASGSNGASLSGTMTSPTAGSGSWTNTGASGTWTATHI